MRSNIWVLLVMAAYFTVADIGYAIWSYLYFGAVEPIGTAAIGLLVILSLFIAFYLYSGMRRSAVLPEDNLDGEIAEDAGEVGFFSPWSWWPVALGLGAALVFLSLAVGWWLTYIAVPFAIVAVVGFVFEYSRGAHAH
ncbi:MAG: cytochrome c oxidase subunit 4 [Aquiluna sp.]|nr:cytochrome c oxidase subunit 4 [Aquiluna sp.]